jgi:O-acetyl-ADP-ribose deacetylase (regulator of RNase III)
MKTNIRETALEIVPGNIAVMAVDAIANAANDELWMGAGVAGAIKLAGGEGIEKEAMAQAPIELGDAVKTTGGDLKAKWVIHAAVMRSSDLQTNADVIARATKRTLEIADRAMVRSLALPAFGTGVGGFPLYACANVMMGEVRRFIEANPTTNLKRIVFAVYGEPAKAAFKNAMAGLSRFQTYDRG